MTFLRRYLLPRLFQYVVVIFVGTTIVFISTRLTPADPVQQTIQRITAQGGYMDPAAVEEFARTLRELYGLEGSVLQQYAALWKRLLIGNFGRSYTYFPTPVIQLIRTSLPWTLGLLSLSSILAWLAGTLLGGAKRLGDGLGVVFEFIERRFQRGGFVGEAAGAGDGHQLAPLQRQAFERRQQVTQRIGMRLPKVRGAGFLVVLIHLDDHA